MKAEEDFYSEASSPGQPGAVYSLSNDAPAEECEAIKLLHEAVKEVTGRAVEPRPKPRIGFLP